MKTSGLCSAEDGAAADGGAGGAGGGAGAAGAGGGGAGGDGGAGGGAADGGGAAAAFYEAFTDANLKTSPAVQKFKTVEEMAAGYVSLEKRYGIDPARRIDLPADPNDAEGMKAVYEKLGAPKDADGYGFKLDDKATDGDKALVGAFGKTAHELGLSVKQAEGLMKFMGEQVAADATANAAALATRATEGKAVLEKEFGQAFEPRLKEIRGLVEKYGEPDLAEAVKGDNIYGFPNLAKMLGKLVDRMAEGGAGGDPHDAGVGDRAMTPAQATAAVRTLEGDPVKGAALRDAKHPQHKAVVEERNRLLQMTTPVKA